MSERFDRYRAALILAEAAFSNDIDTAKNLGCHPRTISNYRQRLETDEKLRNEYRLALYNKSKQWVSRIPKALDSAIRFFERSLDKLPESDPKSLDAVMNAVSVLHEIDLINDSIKQKLEKKKS